MLIYSHNRHSRGARDLARALNCRRIKHQNSKFKATGHSTVINWGSSELPEHVKPAGVIVNHPITVRNTTDKLNFFKILQREGVSFPPFADNRAEALKWASDGSVVVVRRLLRGSEARGLEIFDPSSQKPSELPTAPLYTKYIKKQDEWRVHVAFDEVISFQKKVRRNAVPDDEVNWKVRNLAGGFVFQRNGINLPADIKKLALDAHKAAGLEFGAYDLIYNRKQKQGYVLEVNTAPGLEGTTLDDYVAAFRKNVK